MLRILRSSSRSLSLAPIGISSQHGSQTATTDFSRSLSTSNRGLRRPSRRACVPNLINLPARTFSGKPATASPMSPIISGPDHPATEPEHILSRICSHGSRPFMRDGDRVFTYSDLHHYAAELSPKLKPYVKTALSQPPLSHPESTSPLPPRIAYLVPSGFEYAVTTAAVWDSQAVAVPLHTAHPVAELEYIVQDSGACLLVAHPKFESQAQELSRLCNVPVLVLPVHAERDAKATDAAVTLPDGSTFTPDMLKSFPAVHPAADITANATASFSPAPAPLTAPSLSSPALFIFTSGTTGKPKAVVITHSALMAQVSAQAQAWEWSSADHIVNLLPLHHVHGVVNIYMVGMWSGARITSMSFNADKVWDMICEGVDENEKVDVKGTQNSDILPAMAHFGDNYFTSESTLPRPRPHALSLFMAVPTIYAKLLEANANASPALQLQRQRACAQFRMMVSGSMALPASTMARWRDATAHQLLERYGMTELGMALTVPYRGLRVEGSVGRPFAGVQARLLLKETDADKGGDGTWAMGPGELLIRGPNVFKEYYNRRTATEESFVQDPDHVAYDLPNSQRWFEVAPKWFLTGDVAAVDHQGNICLQGRASVDILKISGYKVSALDVERMLLDHPAVAEVAVVGLPSEAYGQTMCAIIVPSKNSDASSLSLSALRAWCKDKAADYKVPRALWVCDHIPRNAMGKVNKKHLVSVVPKEVYPVEKH